MSLILKGALAHKGLFHQMHLLHVYVHGCCAQAAYPHYRPHMNLPTVLLTDLTALTAATKQKYSHLIRCYYHMIDFDIPAVKNIHG